jgi:hypothetical protein
MHAYVTPHDLPRLNVPHHVAIEHDPHAQGPLVLATIRDLTQPHLDAEVPLGSMGTGSANRKTASGFGSRW